MSLLVFKRRTPYDWPGEWSELLHDRGERAPQFRHAIGAFGGRLQVVMGDAKKQTMNVSSPCSCQ